MGEPRTFPVVVEKGEQNFSACSPDLPGCVASGSTLEGTLKNMKQAIVFHLHGLEEDSRPIPSSSTVDARLLTVG